MAKEKKTMSVVTLPLIVREEQVKLLNKRFEIYRALYNQMLQYEIKRIGMVYHDKRYVDARNLINEVYKLTDEKEKKARKKSEEYKEAVKMSNDVLREYGISEYGFYSEILKRRTAYVTNVASNTATMSIAAPMWAAMEKYIYGNGNVLHFKKRGTWKSIASNGKSGIRIVDENGKTVLHPDGKQKLFVKMSVPHGKTILMPIKIDHKDMYKLEMLDRNIKVVRIVKKPSGTKDRFVVQLTVEGAPATRYDKDGNIKNPIGDGKIGVYIDTTSATIAFPDGNVKNISLKLPPKNEKKIAELQRYMDASRRAMNPDNYNPDGTIKNGIMEDGKRKHLFWLESNGYKKAKRKLQDLYRIDAENRTLQRNICANEILSYGNQIIINDYPFQSAAMRRKVEKSDGDIERYKKAGKAIGENAPAMLVSIIDRKLVAETGYGVTKVKLSDVDYSDPNYREYYAKQLLEELEKSEELPTSV